MKETTQHELGKLLVLLGEKMQSNSDAPVEIDSRYVTEGDNSFLQIGFRVKASGPGDSDPMGCREIVDMVLSAGCWSGSKD
jgi:hypothetical protein